MIWPWSKFRRMEREAATMERTANHAQGRVQELERTVDTLRDALEMSQKYVREHLAAREALTETIVQMKRDGFQPPAPNAPAPDPGPDLPAEVESALRDVAEPGTSLYRAEALRAAEELAGDRGPEEVAEAIRRGGNYQPWS